MRSAMLKTRTIASWCQTEFVEAATTRSKTISIARSTVEAQLPQNKFLHKHLSISTPTEIIVLKLWSTESSPGLRISTLKSRITWPNQWNTLSSSTTLLWDLLERPSLPISRSSSTSRASSLWPRETTRKQKCSKKCFNKRRALSR